MQEKVFTKCIAAVIFIAYAITAIAAKSVKIEMPWVEKPNTGNLFVEAVELTPDSTTVTFRTYCYLWNNINIQPGAHLEHGGNSYAIRSAEGIQLGKKINIPALGDSIFSISFEPLPLDTKTFDFIDGDKGNHFKLIGIHTDKTFAGQMPIDQINVLPEQKWEKGIAVLKGQILNYDQEDEKKSVEVYPRSALGTQIEKKTGVASVNEDGSFTVSIPIYQSYQPCFLTAPGFYGLIYLSPGTESYVTIDQSQRWSRGNQGNDGSVTFTGANSELNNQLSLNIGHDMVWDCFSNNYSRNKAYTAQEYSSDIMLHSRHRKDKIDRLPFTPAMKQLLNIIIDNDIVISHLDNMDTDFMMYNDDFSYYDFAKRIDVNNPMLMWAEIYDSMISRLYGFNLDRTKIFTTDNTSTALYTYMIDNKIVADDDMDLVQSLIKHNTDNFPQSVIDEYISATCAQIRHYSDSLNLEGRRKIQADKLIGKLQSGNINQFNTISSYYVSWLYDLITNGYKLKFQGVNFKNDYINTVSQFYEDNDSIIKVFLKKYEDVIDAWNMENNIDKSIANIKKITDISSPTIRQLFTTNAYINFIEHRNTLKESYISYCRKNLPNLFYDYVMSQNQSMANVLRRSNVNILEMAADTSGDEILKQLAEKHKGKVAYIDIWGTWCSPCLHAITEIEPVKKEYADNVSFVYLADESSPKEAWEEKIQTIEGDHLRLTQTQMRHIMNRFGFNGYPSYIVLGKNGEVAFAGHLYFIDDIKELLDKEIAKE